MEGKSETTAHRTAPITRIAWLATFVVPLVLAVLLLGVKSAQAAQIVPATTPFAFEEELEFEEEGEFEEEACEVAEGEFEEGFLGEAAVEKACEEGEGKEKAAGPSSVAPEECLLRSAHARLVAYDSHDQVRLTVGYTTYEPAVATIAYGAKDGGVSFQLGTAKRHLGRSGVVRLTKALGDSEMATIEAAGHFTIWLRIAEAPASCRRFETEQLTAKRASKHQTVWSQTD